MFPDGQVHEQHWAGLLEPDNALVSLLDARFDGLQCDTVVPIRQGVLRIDWKGSEQGGAIGSFYLDDQLFLCTLLASGLNAEEDEVYLTTTGRAWDKSDMVRGFFEGASSPFAALNEIADRPLLVAMLVPMLPPALYDQINGIELVAVTAYLARLGRQIGIESR
jgi:hypothetical protein